MSTNDDEGCTGHSWDALTSLYYLWSNTQHTLIRSVQWYRGPPNSPPQCLIPFRTVAMSRWVGSDPSAPAKPALTAVRSSEAVIISHMGAEWLRLKKKKKNNPQTTSLVSVGLDLPIQLLSAMARCSKQLVWLSGAQTLTQRAKAHQAEERTGLFDYLGRRAKQKTLPAEVRSIFGS